MVSNEGPTASFLYDADGNRLKGVVKGIATVYIAGLYEWQPGATTKYYDGGGIQRNGYADGNGVSYVLDDHLGSTSMVVSQSGVLLSSYYYYPFGGNRSSTFDSLTAKRFTGQYHESGLAGDEGLSYYVARWYDAQLGRFISADSIVPEPSNAQSLNRYVYALSNPLRYTDPTGHDPCIAAPCEPFPADNVLTVDEGVGEVRVRQYQVTLSNPSVDSNTAYEQFKEDFPSFLPSTATFTPDKGRDGVLTK